MDTYGQLWTFADAYKTAKDVYGHLQTTKDACGQLRTLADSYEQLVDGSERFAATGPAPTHPLATWLVAAPLTTGLLGWGGGHCQRRGPRWDGRPGSSQVRQAARNDGGQRLENLHP